MLARGVLYYCSKPETGKLEVPGWGGCFIKMFTFDWADTSEVHLRIDVDDGIIKFRSRCSPAIVACACHGAE